jgi:glycosyltransferase involved in cell wall biosynthesis
MPPLSIIVANYNYAHTLESALDSILLHNTSSFEMIVIDDGSTDDSRKILQKYRSDPRVKIVHNTRNRGVVETYNQGIALAKGEFLHFFATDDLHLPKTVDRMIALFQHHPEISLFSSHYSYFYTPQQIETVPLVLCKTFSYFDPGKVKTLFSHTGFWIPGNTLFVRRSIFLPYAPYDPAMGPLHDWVINHQIAMDYGVGYIPETLMSIRKHSHSFNHTLTRAKKKALWLYLLEQCRHNPKLDALAKTGLFRMIGLRTIYLDLLLKPRYWKYTLPILRKLLNQK